MNDLINRQATISIISEYFDGLEDNDTVSEHELRDLINEIPSVQVKEKTGIWLNSYGVCKCSLCGYCFEREGYKKYFNFCPCCGAKMGSGDELCLK